MTPSDSAKPTAKRYVMLFVDDEPDILSSTKEFLEASLPGLTVRTASSGPAGLKVLEKEKVDLIITDYKMEGMDGITLLKRAQSLQPECPKVLLTAFPKLDLAIEAINEIQVSKFLTKPLPAEALLSTVKSLLRVSPPAKPPAGAVLRR